MSVFTHIRITFSLSTKRWRVIDAQPWWEPNTRHVNHFRRNGFGNYSLFLRIPFYSPYRSRVGDFCNPRKLLFTSQGD